MRQQSRIQVTVRGVEIGGPRPLICLPMMAESRIELSKQAKELAAMQPDLLEWRADAYSRVLDVEEILSALGDLRQAIGGIPLIFTCRIDREGGVRHISQEVRLALIEVAIASGNIDLVDIELCNEGEFVASVRRNATAYNCKLILSHHNFQETPGETFIVGKLLEAQTAGADIAKLAVMPKDYTDVLTLLTATNNARNGVVAIPLVTMSMGWEGRISRMAGGLFGSDITFASGSQASAPGQMQIDALRTGMALLFQP
ncbi:MAG: type I 3-dehydroquinate dehydratase [Proteobacteria bacterium]|nr:type I 3-dehydroquinate dehydratase [Pseudomonadota bacterium]